MRASPLTKGLGASGRLILKGYGLALPGSPFVYALAAKVATAITKAANVLTGRTFAATVRTSKVFGSKV